MKTSQSRWALLLPDMERYEAYRRKTVAFEEWRQKLSRDDRLPRGPFFKGRKAGAAFFVMDEFWQARPTT